MSSSRANLMRALLIVTLIAGLFCIPLFLAYWWTHHPRSHAATTNRGTLIQPPIPIETLHLSTPTHGKWTLILLTETNHCESSCQNQLHWLNQIQRACGKDQGRINPPVVVTKSKNTDCVLIADPHGNIMMRYDLSIQSTPFMNIFNDLRYLLRVSQIG